MSQFLSKIIIVLLTLLGIAILIGEIFNFHIYFPLNLAENKEIPYHRMQSIRLSLILCFYYLVLYVFWQGKWGTRASGPLRHYTLKKSRGSSENLKMRSNHSI